MPEDAKRSRGCRYVGISAAIALAFCWISAPAQADIYVTTLDNPAVPTGWFLAEDQWVSMPFTTDSNAYQLNSVTARLGVMVPNTGFTYTAALYEVVSAVAPSDVVKIGPLAATFTYTPHSFDVGVYDVIFTSTDNYILNPNTTYAFALRTDTLDELVNWMGNVDTYGFDTEVPGSSWDMPPYGLVFYGPFDVLIENARAAGAVNATMIPEPSVLMLSSMVMVVALGLRRKALRKA